MKKAFKLLGALLVLAVLLMAWPAFQVYQELEKARSEDPAVWLEDIRALEKKTAGRYEPGEAVVFVGSSSIRLWRTLEQDMAPLPVLQHGFGGAKLGDVVHYAERLVNAYQPRAVVIFAGTNDISPEAVKPAKTLLTSYQAFIDIVRREQPGMPVFFIGITPSPLRWEVWAEATATNELIRQWSATQSGLYYIDTAPALLDAQGKPDASNYVFDGLHLNKQGYARWTAIIKPRVLEILGP